LSVEEVALLTEALKANTTVKELVIFCNPIQDAGVQFIADMLRVNQSITSLTLNYTRMTADGFVAICLALAENQGVKTFKINAEDLTNIGLNQYALYSDYSEAQKEAILSVENERVGNALFTLFEKNRSIQTISMSNVTMLGKSLSDEVVLKMFSGLTHNNVLESLQLFPWSSGFISATSMQWLNAILDDNKTLKALPFFPYNFEDTESVALMKQLKQKVYNNACEAGAVAIVEMAGFRLNSLFSQKLPAEIYAAVCEQKVMKLV
jgi:hypothetical protein